MKVILNCPQCKLPTPIYVTEDTYLCKHTEHICIQCGTVLKAKLTIEVKQDDKCK